MTHHHGDSHQHGSHNKGHGSGHGHYMLQTSTATKIGGALMVLTVITVAVAQVDLGWMNFPVAMLVATVKALLVCAFFMNLLHDHKENTVIFGTSFIFLAIFLVLTGFDLFFRPATAFVKPAPFAAAGNAKPRFTQPWVHNAEIQAWGKELFGQNCVSCHGAEGKGDGVAAGSLNPKPRNFTSGDAWKKGRKPSEVFKTLTDGLPPSAMASYSALPAEQRWALAHYVLSLGPTAPTDTNEDLAKVGIDPAKGSATEAVKPEIPVRAAMDLMIRDAERTGVR